MKKYILEKSNKKNKKFMIKNGKIIHFGSKGYSDFTISKDINKKKNYIKRHIVNEDFNNLNSAGAWAKNILWNKKTIKSSIKNMENRFNINIINKIKK